VGQHGIHVHLENRRLLARVETVCAGFALCRRVSPMARWIDHQIIIAPKDWQNYVCNVIHFSPKQNRVNFRAPRANETSTVS
jgi:hypothetical protein